MDKEKQQPVARASVFLNNTSIGTTSDENGKFAFQIPSGKFELIVSSIGYESHYEIFSTSDPDKEFQIELKLKTEEMEEVVILPYDPDGWRNWGDFFLQHFIGTRAEAKDCKIKNTPALKFRNNKVKHELIVSAAEPLIIENKALGYRIIYDLVKFNYNFKTRYLIYSGYPFFEEMEGNKNRKEKWKNRRKEVYEGSLMHFMRSLYSNKMAKEGFEIRRLKKIENVEKTRIKQVLMNRRNEDRSLVKSIPDSSRYYERILQEGDMIDIVGKDILTGDSIAYAVDSVTAGAEFENYLLVMYMKKDPPREYIQLFPKAGNQMISEITLVTGRPIEIKSNGMFYDSMELLSLGYWSWSEKISSMLPFDYRE
jgi:hypothetical protein